MMRLGILSDTHDEVERTRSAVALLRRSGAEVLAHCGDITGPEIVAVCGVMPCYFTFGNHDADRVPELRRAIADVGGFCLEWGGEFALGGRRISLAHGHMTSDVRRLLKAGPDYLLTGHLHLTRDHREGPARRICPGALHAADEFTVALLDLGHDEVRFLNVTD